MQTLASLRARLAEGLVIPAHPLALNRRRELDERRQRALSRYYAEAGAGGLAVAVHATQFAIRNREIGLFRPVLELAMEEARRFAGRGGRELVLIGGICGRGGLRAIPLDDRVLCDKLSRRLGLGRQAAEID